MDSSGSIEIAQRLSATSTSLKPTSPFLKTLEAFSCEETSQTIVRLPWAAAARPERDGNGRLADASFAGHEDEALVE